MFEMDSNQVHSIVSAMMISGELHASWDHPTNSILVHHIEPTRLQYLAMMFAEKASQFVDNTERLNERGFKTFDGKNQNWQGTFTIMLLNY